jgi:hypothetical protein
MKRCAASFAYVALLACARPGFAGNEPGGLDLSWQSPPECPTGGEIRAEALRLASAESKLLPSVRAKVTIEKEGESSYVLTLTTGAAGPSAIQTFRAGTCRAVAQAAAVTLALILNPTDPLVASDSAGSGSRQAATRASDPIRAALVGLAGLQLGSLPKIGPIFGAELGLNDGPASVWLGGAYGPSQRAMVDGQPNGVGGELALGRGMLYGCWALRGHRPSLNLCTGLDFSRISGRGVGVTDGRAGAVYWFSALGGGTTEVALLGNIVLRLGAFVATPFSHPAAFVENAGTVHRPATVTASLHAGAGVVWP